MKGTLCSADFVKDSTGGLRLIELNTDTAIQDSLAADRLDWTEFLSVLSTNSITELDVIYKNVQKSIVDDLETALTTAGSAIVVNRIIEPDNGIYPTAVEDADSKFILRLAYDQGAIFDSEYAAKDLNVYKLFLDNNQPEKVPGLYYSGPESDTVLDTLEENVNPDNIADFALRKIVSVKGNDLNFYKTGNTSATPAERVTAAKTELGGLGEVITNYYAESGATKASSIRTYQVIYGTNLDIVNIGGYKIDAILDFPTALDVDLTATASLIPSKHYSEFSVEGINRVGGITVDHSIVRYDGGADLANSAVIGDKYLSYFVNGAPDTDQYGSLFKWVHSGDSMPTGSYTTGSVLISDNAHTNTNNAVIKITLANGDILRVGGLTNIIIHQSSTDTVRYVYASAIKAGDSLFNSDGEKVGITTLEAEIIDQAGTHETFEFNLEDTDIFTVSGSNIIIHNAPCFVPGTLISTDKGQEPIENIKVGDLVVAFNHEIGENELKKVEAITKKENVDVITIEVNEGRSVTSTLDHPFFTKEKGYASYAPKLTQELAGLEVKVLEEGDEILLESGEYVNVLSIKEAGIAPIVHNLSKIQDHKNFYANGLLVHNRYK